MEKYVDLTGAHIGYLTVIKKDPKKREGDTAAWWICRCTCGKYVSIRGSALRGDRTHKKQKYCSKDCIMRLQDGVNTALEAYDGAFDINDILLPSQNDS